MPAFTFQLCDGDLRERINEKIKRERKFSQELILDWFAMITMALEYIHAKDLLHRDLKPEVIIRSFYFGTTQRSDR